MALLSYSNFKSKSLFILSQNTHETFRKIDSGYILETIKHFIILSIKSTIFIMYAGFKQSRLRISNKWKALCNQIKYWKSSIPQLFVATIPKYGDTSASKSLFLELAANKWSKTPMQIILKNWATSIGFIVAVA